MIVSVSDGILSIIVSLIIIVININDVFYVMNLFVNIIVVENDVIVVVIDVNVIDFDDNNIIFILSGIGSDDFVINFVIGWIILSVLLNYEL